MARKGNPNFLMARKGNPISVRWPWLCGLTGVLGGLIWTVVIGVFFSDMSVSCSWIAPEQLMEWILSLFPSVFYILRALLGEILSGRDRCAPLGGTVMENETPYRSEEETSPAHVNPTLSSDSGPSVNHHLGARANTTPPAGGSSQSMEQKCQRSEERRVGKEC